MGHFNTKKLTSDFDEVLEIYLFKYCQGGQIFHAVGIIQIAITLVVSTLIGLRVVLNWMPFMHWFCWT